MTRTEHLKAFESMGFPTKRNEAWKYTDLSHMAGRSFADASGLTKISLGSITSGCLADAHRIVFVNGVFSAALSDCEILPEGVMLTLDGAQLDAFPDYFKPSALAHLNFALHQQGVTLRIGKGVVLEKPIHCLLLSASEGNAHQAHVRNAIVLEEGASASVVFEYRSIDAPETFNNSFTQVVLHQNARLHAYKLQQESACTTHTDALAVLQHKDTYFQYFSFAIGAALAREDVHVQLMGENAECDLHGYYQGKGSQHLDNHLQVDHSASYAKSNQNYKGIVGDKARAIFNGKVLVPENIKGTQAYQSNKNLLLSKTAEVDTKPELEIYSEDVKCSHGATVGQLDEAALFYLQSRGIPEALARQLLIDAFSAEIIYAIKDTVIAQYINTVIGVTHD